MMCSWKRRLSGNASLPWKSPNWVRHLSILYMELTHLRQFANCTQLQNRQFPTNRQPAQPLFKHWMIQRKKICRDWIIKQRVSNICRLNNQPLELCRFFPEIEHRISIPDDSSSTTAQLESSQKADLAMSEFNPGTAQHKSITDHESSCTELGISRLGNIARSGVKCWNETDFRVRAVFIAFSAALI
ncbi:hypothetical protein MJO29_006485, partial [Puccinia striiformis f. sp. tritici]